MLVGGDQVLTILLSLSLPPLPRQSQVALGVVFSPLGKGTTTCPRWPHVNSTITTRKPQRLPRRLLMLSTLNSSTLMLLAHAAAARATCESSKANLGPSLGPETRASFGFGPRQTRLRQAAATSFGF